MTASYTRAEQVTSFLSRVAIKGENDCWLWTGCSYGGGYGSFKWRGKMRGANIVAWEVANGQDVPAGLDVRHTCDNPPCCNPRHLIAGTTQENMLDMHRKQRCSKVALTPEKVRIARAMLAEKKLHRVIAAALGVNKCVISNLHCGRTYRHVD